MSVLTGLSLNDFAAALLQHALRESSAARAALFSLSGDRVCCQPAQATGGPAKLPASLIGAIAAGQIFAVANSAFSDYAETPEFSGRSISFCCAALHLSGIPVAALYLERGPNAPFTHSEVEGLLRLLQSGGLTWNGASSAEDDSLDLPPLHVLLVEDNEVNCKVAKAFLEHAGHSVRVCNDGGPAVVAAAEDDFDIVLMDIRMPGLDGVQATQRIRGLSDRRRAAVPILALTANFSTDEVERYRQVGMNGVIQKPLRNGDLERALAPLFDIAAPSPYAAPCSPKPITAMSGATSEIIDQTRLSLLAEALPADKLQDLFTAARGSIRETCDDLLQQWDRQNIPAAGKAAHRLAGVAANFGCSALGDLARSIESDIREGSDGLRHKDSLARLVEISLQALPGLSPHSSPLNASLGALRQAHKTIQ